MTEVLSTLAIHVSRHPLVFVLAVAVVLRMAGRVLRNGSDIGPSLLGGGFKAASVTALAAYPVIVMFYATTPQYFDAAEPTMTAVGWLFQAGLPVYHEVDSAERYSHIYGPMVFIVQGVALQLFGPTIQTSKSVGCALALGALFLTFVAAHARTSGRRAVLLAGLCALLLLGFRNYSFWTRAEPLQIFCMAAALACIHWRLRTVAAVLFGLLVGVLWNLKITGPLYSLPLFVLLFYRAGLRRSVLAAAVTAIATILPFVAFSNVSLEGYVTWMRLSAQTGLLLATLRQNIEWAVFFALPLVLASYGVRRDDNEGAEWMVVVVALVVATCGVIVAGSKPGAGPYHLLPFLPLVVYLVAARIGRRAIHPVPGFQPLAGAFLLIAVSVGLAQQVQFLNTMISRRELDVTADIERIEAVRGGVIEMGYAWNDPVTFQRPLLVFRNNSYFLDQPAVGEHALAGLRTPQATIEAVRRCSVNYWLVPKGEEPFSGRNMYGAVRMQPLFSDAFRAAFFETHALVDSTEYFDVWQCRGMEERRD